MERIWRGVYPKVDVRFWRRKKPIEKLYVFKRPEKAGVGVMAEGEARNSIRNQRSKRSLLSNRRWKGTLRDKQKSKIKSRKWRIQLKHWGAASYWCINNSEFSRFPNHPFPLTKMCFLYWWIWPRWLGDPSEQGGRGCWELECWRKREWMKSTLVTSSTNESLH